MSYRFEQILNSIKINKCKKGSCVAFVELANEKLKDSGEEYYIVEGYVKFIDDKKRNSGKMQHSWIEKDDMIYDYTLEQFHGWDLSTVEYFIKKKYTPIEYFKLTKKYPLHNIDEYMIESTSYILTEKLTSTIAMYMVIKRLLTPWTKWKAYTHGIIDKNGKRLRKPKNSKERDGWDILDRFCWAMKRLVTKYIGDRKFVYLFSAAYLMKENINTIINTNFSKYNQELNQLTALEQRQIYKVLQEMNKQNLINESNLDLETNILKILNKTEPILNKYNIQKLFESIKPTTNSLGNPIHHTQEGIDNFWRWFGNSKCVDEQGRPLVFYHGTNANFKEFSHRLKGDKDFGFLGSGFYFTLTKDLASEYSTYSSDENSNVMMVYLKLENPYIFDKDKDKRIYDLHDNTKSIERTRDLILNKYDGVIYHFEYEDMDSEPYREVVVFYKKNIKSVFNNGNFSPMSNIITEDGETSVATTVNDIAQFTPRIGKIQRRKFNPLIILRQSNLKKLMRGKRNGTNNVQ